MNKLSIAKKHFRKYGLSESVIKTIVALIPDEEEATEETITEQLQAYEPLAKSFQAEAERRVSLAVKGLKSEPQEVEPKQPNPQEKTEPKDPVLEALGNITKRLEAMEKGQVSAGLNQSAMEKLKALKMTDKEIEAVMFGRSFETEEAVNDFIGKQSEIYEEILSARHKENAGNGFNTMSGQGGTYKKEAMEQDIAEFNKVY